MSRLFNWSKKRIWILGIFSFALLHGLGVQMRGPLLISFKETFTVSESLLGLVAPASSIGFTFFLFFFGMYSGKLDIKRVLLVGAGLSSIFALLIGVSSSFFLLLFFFVCWGAAGGIFRGTDRPVLSHLFSGKRGWIFNLHELAWAIGATSGPLFVNLVLSFGDWRLAYVLLALFYVPTFLLITAYEPPDLGGGETVLSFARFREMLKNPVVPVMMILIAINAGIEGGFFIWLPYHLSNFYTEFMANMAFFGYLAAYIPGRYFYSRLSERGDYLEIVIFNASAISLLLFLAFVVFSGYVMLALVFSVGFLISGNFPTLLAMGTDIFPEHSGPVNALAMTSSSLGLGVFPAVMGVVVDLYSSVVAMRLLIFMGIIVLLVSFFFKKISQ